ncbi:class F sortase [Frigoribacterium sp. CG_9.8]|uniref:class F sortase n=1 Tax=Frigoribacterium sp. CG_9.8 TaxID=2787733 RepID=UPI001E5A3BBB|nr:class F sortase [Frigoribacterium sp. CG_9.8]
MTGRARLGATLAVCLALPVLAGCTAVTGTGVAGTAAPRSTASATPPPAASVPRIPTADASLTANAAAVVVAPVRIQLDRLGIDMKVTSEGLDADGAMALPPNAADAGWYRYSPGVNSRAGATVIAAHIDSRDDGIGPFSRLRNATAGDRLTLTGADGSTVAYTVTELRQVGKIDAPMAEVFDTAGAPRLSLVTCGGSYNSKTGHYVDNVIVTATPVAAAASGN